MKDLVLTSRRCDRETLSRRLAHLLFFLLALTPAVAFGLTDREAAVLAGDGNAPLFLKWLGIIAVACGIGAIAAAAAARRMRKHTGIGCVPQSASPATGELSTAACLTITAAIFFGALSLSGLLAFVLASQIGLKPTSSESGPLETIQSALWLVAAVTALLSVFGIRDRESRGALLLLGGAALLAAAREADLHEKLNPQAIGEWGVRFRGDWWFSAATPIGPRLLWAVVAVVIVAVGLYLLRRGGPAFLIRGRRHGRLIPLLGLVAFLMFLGFGFDDLLRYRPGINLRQSQVCEETIELAAPLVYLGVLVWAIRLGRSATRTPIIAGDSNRG